MKKKFTLLFVYLLLPFLTLQAQNWTQIGADINGATGDWLGKSVSLSSDGTVMAIGAPSGKNHAGYVRVYQNLSGAWTQVGSDIDGETAWDQSGHSVSLSSDGTIVAIGAPCRYENMIDAGYVRIYQNLSGTWTQVGADIHGKTGGDEAGFSVSLSSDGMVVAIGAPRRAGTDEEPASVCIYQNQGGTWTQVGADINGKDANDEIGYSVSLSSNGAVVAIGTPFNRVYNEDNIGYVSIYQNQDGTWTQMGADIYGEIGSGVSVSLNSDGTVVAIGSPFDSGNGTNFGSVRIFQYQDLSETWVQVGAIDGESTYENFGGSVSLSSDGKAVAVGARGTNNNRGHVGIFQNEGDNWTQIGADIDGEAEDDASGTSVSLNSNGTVVAIGAPINGGISVQAGHVRVFQLSTTDVTSIPTKTISIYPNPTSGLINLEFTGASTSLNASSIQKLTLYDITGKQLVEKLEVNQHETIDLSGFTNGIYILRIEADCEVFTTRIVKE